MDGRKIIILVMGACGAGKSTFINTLLQEEKAKVVHELSPSTDAPIPFSVPNQLGLNCTDTLWLVEIPGFDGTETRDISLLKELGNWTKKCHDEKSVIGGIIYLHDISQKRMDSTTQRNLDILNKLCGESALGRIVLATTNWPESSEPNDQIIMRERDLIDKHWSAMIDKGSRASRFVGTPQSAAEVVKMALQGLGSSDNLFDIQKELVAEKKDILETRAGKQLHASVVRNAMSAKDTTAALQRIRISIYRLFFFL